MRLALFCGGLIAIFISSYLLWGDEFEQLLGGDRARDWLLSFEPWTWLLAIGLMVADLLLPVPATAVMAALGLIYGPLVGGAIGSAGSFLAGATGYLLCRAMGERAAVFFLGRDSFDRAHRFFSGSGGWLVALSRWMIILPEMVSCLAGLARMPAGRYFAALACGSIPLGFAYAAVGSMGSDRPILALALSASIPVFLWWLIPKPPASDATSR